MPGLIVGLNKYAHSASCAIADAKGRVLFALARERLTRKKHDGGDVAGLMRHAMDQIGACLSDIQLVVETCHLFRVDRFEPRLPFTVSQRYYTGLCLDEHNLPVQTCRVRKFELSHHLAHAWAALLATPFKEGVIVVMDGMGSARSEITSLDRPTFFADGRLPRHPAFAEVLPPAPETGDWREAESVYSFQDRDLSLLFKRWTPLRGPSLLHNYGFEDMESLGAVYSRASSHIFADWNACGKVMGLAAYGRPRPSRPTMTGPLEDLKVHWPNIESFAHPGEWRQPPRKEHRDLAAQVQADLEQIALDYLTRLRRLSGARNLVLTGGVALNSQLNGRVARECGYDNVYVPSAPGDDGAALGCAAFGLHHVLRKPRRAKTFLSPYLGGRYSVAEMRQALDDCRGRVTFTRPRDLIGEVAQRLARGQVVAWFQGRSEFGPRALGARSILAHPAKPGMKDHLNLRVKGREPFRPFAPTVLAERVRDFFADPTPSPYMSFTVPVRPSRAKDIPAVTHADQTARLQTLRRDDNPLYYDLIRRFEKLTGLPMVLNTSYNLAGEAIVETPSDALSSFLNTEMDALALGPFLVTKRPFPLDENRRTARFALAPDALVETLAQANGALDRATVYLRGKGHEATELSLAILDNCDPPATLDDLTQPVRAQTGASASRVEKGVRRLFDLGILVVDNPPRR
ncbi:MAG TPA: carbamoyltransferase C-terminal domain-containing protein, partial [Candidatus Brocadiia bacterium]|nr:carbamoyltransferase C-terminal domain-containing protein [Candidatus Brocadiia bacterium]